MERHMTLLKRTFLGIVVALAAQPASAQSLAMDMPTDVAGIETVCTGVSLDARQDPRWAAYGLKVEIAGAGGKYLGSEKVALGKGGQSLLEVTCDGPWLLFRLPPGRYDVEAKIGAQTVSSAAFVPVSSQGRIILRFTDPD
jgi:hypothetical protein